LEPGDELVIGGIRMSLVATPEISRADVIDLESRRARSGRARRRYRRALAAAAAALMIAAGPAGSAAVTGDSGGADAPSQVKRVT
jgi:hypothetical protein